jgi:hypothetical protein
MALSGLATDTMVSYAHYILVIGRMRSEFLDYGITFEPLRSGLSARTTGTIVAQRSGAEEQGVGGIGHPLEIGRNKWALGKPPDLASREADFLFRIYCVLYIFLM